ncbi:MAG: hypothetical protein AUJ71_01835 [Candidatus Omnitrophica bacterium CG1_02_49_16]|nr:MAG: hypothetical protein AUJ71_01835 [Candidatus Omnitrophica bacterium CG1_02_49_16]
MLPFEIKNRRDEIRYEIEKFGAELVDITFYRSGRRGVLVFVVDKPAGITLDDCAQINRHLGNYFDSLSEEARFFTTPYYLEVNSPGLDRLLKCEADFKRVIGQRVRVAYKNEHNAGLVCIGEVLEAEAGVVTLQPVDKREKILLRMECITKASREIRIG